MAEQPVQVCPGMVVFGVWDESVVDKADLGRQVLGRQLCDEQQAVVPAISDNSICYSPDLVRLEVLSRKLSHELQFSSQIRVQRDERVVAILPGQLGTPSNKCLPHSVMCGVEVDNLLSEVQHALALFS